MQKKIVLVVPTLQAGGMERVMSLLANSFSTNNGIKVHLICYVKAKRFYSVSDNVILHEPTYTIKHRYKAYYQAKTIFYLRKKINEIKPDSVLSFGETFNSFVILACIFLKVKVFVSDRSKPDKSWGVFHETLRKLLYPTAYGIISQTDYSKKILTTVTGHNNIKVIHNPLNHLIIDDLNKENVILNVGRLISTKGIDILLEMFSSIKKEGWQLWIVGDGPLLEILLNKAKQLGIDEQVVFWGSKKNIEWYYSKAKIFAFTSISEGFPNSLLEAIGAGLPSISFDCIAGPSDLIRDEYNGFLIPTENRNLYKQKLQMLIDQKSLRKEFGENARLISQQFELEKISEEYLNFLLS